MKNKQEKLEKKEWRKNHWKNKVENITE